MTRQRFSKRFSVNYFEIDKTAKATPIAMINYLQECAIAHSESVGFGIDRLKKGGVGWVLKRWLVHFSKYPARGQEIAVETWPSSFERFYANRQFNIKNEIGEIIGQAATLWVFLGIEKKRPQRIPEELGEAYGVEAVKAIEKPFSELAGVEKPEIIKEFQIRRNDIDTNNHVNNTKYVEWMLESVPQEIYDQYILSDLEVEYKKETEYGLTIKSLCSKTILDESNCICIHSIIDKETETELAAAKTVWNKC